MKQKQWEQFRLLNEAALHALAQVAAEIEVAKHVQLLPLGIIRQQFGEILNQ